MDYLKLVERAYTGEKVSKQDWDIDYVAMPIMDILEEYDLEYNGEVIATDEDMLRRFYEAGRKVAIESGIYCQDTGRVIKFTAEEIDEAAANQKKEMIIGRGDDAFMFYARKPEDTRKPGVVAGNPGCPMDEATFCKTVESWAKEPSIDMVTCGSIVDVEGHAVRLGEPSEVRAVRKELHYLNEICAKVGRPGIGRLAAESSVSHVGDLAGMGPDGMREGDAHLVAINNELIITKDNMIRATNSIDTGIRNASLACVMVGGIAGNPAGASVCMIASMLLANLICRADYHLCHPIHLTQIATSARECMWLQSVTCQAFSLCAPNIIICDIYPKSGAGTKELLYEVAANALEITVSGGHLEGCGACDGIKPNCSGLECRMMGNVAAAAAKQKITRKQADEIVCALLKKYEPILKEKNDGLPFDEVYDADTMQPKDFWQKMYDEVAQELKELGLDI
ncbi:MAG: monomethylamine:corrinoid methyltransferase [Lachnospiraceae bacterium]|nr:monomethylamine:corrinoid methyltransferase [Lachnospiraceae bacterium]